MSEHNRHRRAERLARLLNRSLPPADPHMKRCVACSAPIDRPQIVGPERCPMCADDVDPYADVAWPLDFDDDPSPYDEEGRS